MKLYAISIGLVASALSLVGCGDSDDGDSDNKGGSSSNGGSTSTAGTSSSNGGTSSSNGGTSSSNGGTSSTSGGTSSNGGTNAGCDPMSGMAGMMGEMPLDCPAYQSCLEAGGCEDSILSCYGPNFPEEFGGACGPFYNCIVECDCDETCASSCVTTEYQTCLACLLPSLTCTLDCIDEAQSCQ